MDDSDYAYHPPAQPNYGRTGGRLDSGQDGRPDYAHMMPSIPPAKRNVNDTPSPPWWFGNGPSPSSKGN